MKKIFFLLMLPALLLFSGCGSESQEQESDILVPVETESGPESESVSESVINDIKFNSNLETFEEEWLNYLEDKYPTSKIYHVKTDDINCDDCYEVYYKRDLSMIKIKVLDGEKSQETAIVDGLFTEIENTDVCNLYGGSWNECPRLCPTDEEICVTQCGEPVCELDQTVVEYKQVGEQCGADLGDCEFGFSCRFESRDDRYGICE